MKPTILVVTVVHWPDDTRIRERLIRTLSAGFAVLYACRAPGPTDRTGLTHVPLGGGRFRRNLAALRLVLATRWDVLVVHDPELIPCALFARLTRRRPVVFDVHEDFPAAAYTRSWLPRPLRRSVAFLMGRLLLLAERFLTITLAENGYGRLFRDRHPIFPNYPDTSQYPEVGGDPAGPAVYLGDVTRERGADLAAAACSKLGLALTVVGRVTETMEDELRGGWGVGDGLVIAGSLPNPEAIEVLARSSVGLCPLRDLPNYRHSQPTKILEYLAMGLPVVASDLPGTRSLVHGLRGVFLTPAGDSDALAEAIATAARPETVAETRDQAQRVRAEFGWPGAAVAEFYRDLVSTGQEADPPGEVHHPQGGRHQEGRGTDPGQGGEPDED